MRILFIIILGLGFNIILNSQSSSITKPIANSELQVLIKADKLKINETLVNSILNYKKDEHYTSFTEIFYSISGRERVDFIREYLKTDLDEESLEEIRRKVIEQNDGEYQEIVKITDEDILWFNHIKEEMTSKLNNINLSGR